jgi:hypothetical protein
VHALLSSFFFDLLVFVVDLLVVMVAWVVMQFF